MAIKPCPDCGKDVSTMAAACPHCGYPLQETIKAAPPPPPPAPVAVHVKEAKSAAGCLGPVIALILVVWAVGSISTCQRETSPGSDFTVAPSAQPASDSYTDVDRAAWVALMQDEKESAGVRLSRAKAIIQYFPNSADATAAKGLLGQLEVATAEAERNKPGPWRYFTDTDPMTSKPVRSATIQSEAPFELEFPYQGPQHARITLRRHPKWGKDVIFEISEGQITCGIYECPIRVRFGDAAPVTYQGGRAEDGSTEFAFIKQYDGFVSRMRKVNTIRVEFSVYQGGNIVQEFNVRGFDPKRMD